MRKRQIPQKASINDDTYRPLQAFVENLTGEKNVSLQFKIHSLLPQHCITQHNLFANCEHVFRQITIKAR